MPLHHGVSAVAHHRQHALVADAGERGLVRGRADERLRVHLEVARVQDGAERGADGQRLALGRGVGHADQLQREGRELDPTARGDDVELDLAQELRFPQLAAENGGREGRGVHRAAQLPPQVRNGADMVLMGVGDDQAHELVRCSAMKAGSGIMTSTSGISEPPKPMPQSTASQRPEQR